MSAPHKGVTHRINIFGKRMAVGWIADQKIPMGLSIATIFIVYKNFLYILKNRRLLMWVLELILAIIQAVLNLFLTICMIPFVPIVWVIREIKGVTPVYKNTFGNCPKINIKSSLDGEKERGFQDT